MNNAVPSLQPHHQAADDIAVAWLKPSLRMGLLRAGMRVVSHLHPRFGAKVMDRLWFSAPRTQPRPFDQARLESGTRLAFDVQGQHVTGWAWGDGGPTVMLVHGWGGNAGNLCDLVAPLRRRGFRVVAFDAPAHGRSSPSRLGGARVTFFEMAEALRVVAASESALCGIVAHSGGCAVVALAMREGWCPPVGLAFISPFVRPASAINSFGRAIAASPKVVTTFRNSVQEWLGRPWSYLDISDLTCLHQRKLLVMHDVDDKEVPVAHAEALLQEWPHARWVTTRGLGHRRILRDAFVVQEVASFMSAAQEADRHVTGNLLPGSRHELDLAYEESGWIWRRVR